MAETWANLFFERMLDGTIKLRFDDPKVMKAVEWIIPKKAWDRIVKGMK